MNHKMNAFVRTSATTQEVALQKVDIPKIQADEVLIKVGAFGVGIHDRYFIPSEVSFPYVIGSEGAGTIMEKGNQVKEFQIGDRVIFTTILQKQGGSWAEYAVAKQAVLIKLPETLSFNQGAAIPIAGKTALECIREINPNNGDSLFIAGASGAIGTLVIQLAAEKGMHISASASEKNHDYMKSLGAEHTVDYHNVAWKTQVREWSEDGVDTALAIQPGTGSDSIKVVKDGGLLITVSGDSQTVVPERNIDVRQMGHQLFTNHELIDLISKISQEKVKLVIEKEYSFNDALDALRKTETRRARGKLIVYIK